VGLRKKVIEVSLKYAMFTTATGLRKHTILPAPLELRDSFCFLIYKGFAPLELGKTFEMFKSTGSADILVGIFTWSSLWSSKFASKMLALPVKDVAPLELKKIVVISNLHRFRSSGAWWLTSMLFNSGLRKN